MENRTSKATAASKNAYQGKGRGRTEELRGLMQGGDDAGFLKGVEEGLKSGSGNEEVVLKATGKAIERLLGVACWLEGQGGGEEFVVRVRTGSVGAVDDVVVKDGEEDGDGEVGSRVRRVSCLEVGVRYKGL
jgi:ribonuclease P/MRP protein subunit POP7